MSDTTPDEAARIAELQRQAAADYAAAEARRQDQSQRDDANTGRQ